MASCNGAYPSTSSMNNPSFNLGISGDQNGRVHNSAIGPVSARLDRGDRGGVNRLNELLQGINCSTKDGRYRRMPSVLECTKCPALGTAQCWECAMGLCDNCASAHSIISPSHKILKVATSPPPCPQLYSSSDLSPGGVPNGHPGSYSIVCKSHSFKMAIYQCTICDVPVCKECSAVQHFGHTVMIRVDWAQNRMQTLLQGVAVRMETMKELVGDIDIIQRQLGINKRDTVNAVERERQICMKMLDDRKEELMSQINNAYTLKLNSLAEQKEMVVGEQQSLMRIQDRLRHSCRNDDLGDAITAMTTAAEQLILMQETPWIPCEDDVLMFVHPEPHLCRAMAQLGFVNTSVDLRRTVAIGRCKTRARINRFNNLYVTIYDHLGQPCKIAPERELLSVKMIRTDGKQAGPVTVVWFSGMYVVRYKPLAKCPVWLHIKLRGRHIKESPFMITVSYPRDYRKIREPLAVFGSEGGGNGQLCRPWGVCCDLEGNIIVADRSNNRIQIFLHNGTFYHQFGKQGSEPGQFDRPAGVASDVKRRIVVADKDNHRIQVFTLNGDFLFTFGEKGNKNGQFNYPWDVDVNPEGRIIVSDTRNHRVQLFSVNGQFLCKFGYENQPTMWKYFDSPRGVCFSHEGMVVVTDFNNHCLVILTPELDHPLFLGKEGTGPKEFVRPQGVCVDDDGRIIVADSRNNRIQIIEASGDFLCLFGSVGTIPGQFDRPSGICLSPDGSIVVVDFTNTRIQVF